MPAMMVQTAAANRPDPADDKKAATKTSDEEAIVEAYEATRAKPTGPMACYTRIADKAYAITKMDPFLDTIYMLIFISCFYAGASTYSAVADSDWMSMLDIVLAVIFLCESFIKIVAEGTHPWKFFYGSPYWAWNCFDFMSTSSPQLRYRVPTMTNDCPCPYSQCADVAVDRRRCPEYHSQVRETCPCHAHDEAAPEGEGAADHCVRYHRWDEVNRVHIFAPVHRVRHVCDSGHDLHGHERPGTFAHAVHPGALSNAAPCSGILEARIFRS
jgi:hypothetical protein